MCEIAWKIVCARHEKQKERFLVEREKAVSSAAKQSRARIVSGLMGKCDALALRGLSRGVRTRATETPSIALSNEVGGEGIDDEKEEEDEGNGMEEDEDSTASPSSLGVSSADLCSVYKRNNPRKTGDVDCVDEASKGK